MKIDTRPPLNAKTITFLAPESVQQRLGALQAHHDADSSALICAIINAYYESLTSSGEMTSETIEMTSGPSE